MTELTLIQQARGHADSMAYRTSANEFTYAQLLAASASVAESLLTECSDLEEAGVGYIVPAGFNYSTIQWGIWRAGGIAVPLSLSATEPELEYTLTDSQSSTVIAIASLADRVKALCERLKLKLIVIDDEPGLTSESSKVFPAIDESRKAMILYTSGTTNKPKGVVSTHANIQSQIETLVNAWEWQSDDSIPLFLPLHHIHGIINIMSCALWKGATIEPFAKFEMDTILGRVADGAYSVFMAVPTIYVKMIQALQSMTDEQRKPILDGFGKMRLMISGSAALPASVHETWTGLTGQRLLERYGMTEIGMGLSNPYNGERRAGMVGQPLPGVQMRLKSEKGHIVTEEGEPGEIQVKGPCVFLEYFNKPEVTAAAFDEGWFQTGDMSVVEDGYYRIMGRLSVDIIKSGGYKLSALEIEAALLEHHAIQQCAVIGIPDDTWGEAVAAAVVLTEGRKLSLDELRTWCKDCLSKYKMPTRLLCVNELPRNAMGKVTKPAVRKLFGEN